MYRFDGVDYEIRDARCGGMVRDPYWCDTYNGGREKELFWWFEMEVDYRDPDEPAPSVNFDGIFIAAPSWVQLVGKSVAWSSAIDSARDTRYGWTSTFECSLIVRGRLEIADRNGRMLRILAQGEDGWENLFEIDLDYEFEGIVTHGSERDDAESLRARLAQFLSLDHLVQQPIKRWRNNSGSEVAECRFLPRVQAT